MMKLPRMHLHHHDDDHGNEVAMMPPSCSRFVSRRMQKTTGAFSIRDGTRLTIDHLVVGRTNRIVGLSCRKRREDGQ